MRASFFVNYVAWQEAVIYFRLSCVLPLTTLELLHFETDGRGIVNFSRAAIAYQQCNFIAPENYKTRQSNASNRRGKAIITVPGEHCLNFGVWGAWISAAVLPQQGLVMVKDALIDGDIRP